MNDYIYFYLPGMAENFEINITIIQRMHQYPDHFYPNVKIGGVYGCPPGAIWNGGRYANGKLKSEHLDRMITVFHNLGVPLRYTWTNPVLDSKDLEDDFCNWVTGVSEDGINEVLVNNDLMENYIRETYPMYPIISSTTKRLNNIDDLNNELEKDYKLVVIDYDLNNDWEALNKITHPEKCEILINAVCNPKCPFRKEHYIMVGQNQKNGTYEHNSRIDNCPAQRRRYHEIKQLPTFISNEDIFNKYVPMGFRHFKIEGRGETPMKPIFWYLYYLVKPEYREEERAWLEDAFDAMLTQPLVPIYFA